MDSLQHICNKRPFALLWLLFFSIFKAQASNAIVCMPFPVLFTLKLCILWYFLCTIMVHPSTISIYWNRFFAWNLIFRIFNAVMNSLVCKHTNYYHEFGVCVCVCAVNCALVAVYRFEYARALLCVCVCVDDMQFVGLFPQSFKCHTFNQMALITHRLPSI